MQIPLCDEDYTELKILHKKIKNKKDADRVKIILLYHAGYNQKEIASIIFMAENTIGYWIQHFKSCLALADWLKKTINHTGVS